MKDFKPVCFGNAEKMACGELRAVSKEEAGKGHELSLSLLRGCATWEGTSHGRHLQCPDLCRCQQATGEEGAIE